MNRRGRCDIECVFVVDGKNWICGVVDCVEEEVVVRGRGDVDDGV